MQLLLSFLQVLIILYSVGASPTPNPLLFPHVDPNDILCQLPIVKQFLCPKRLDQDGQNVQTAFGMALGTPDPLGTTRYVVRYASAPRWRQSALVTTWALPTGTPNVTAFPLACPQPGVDPSAYTEDCLAMILYIPPNLQGNTPTLMWIHGGSFVVGSATAPGLDGSQLAITTNSIVAVVQYRLGALGFLPPNGQTNLAVSDIINALKFLQNVVPAFGGSSSKITLAGQSSGANMIRALLAAPSASPLFRSAILHSDPMDYGFLSPSVQQALQSNYNTLINCTASDTTCWNSLSLTSILNSQATLAGNAMNIDPSTGNGEPVRPVRDGNLITSPLDSTAPFPQVNKPLMISNVLNEAGLPIYGQFSQPVSEDLLAPICQATFGSSRSNTILSSDFYPAPNAVNGTVDARVQLQFIGTDYIWRCPAWTFARNWVQNGGTAYVGLYLVGASYPGNEAVSYCMQPGVVCHQDDIQIVFGTVQNPTSAQAALVTEVQARYKAFITGGNPNTGSYATWNAATTSDVHALQLGGTGEAPVGACQPSFWGQGVLFDYQLFLI